MVRKLVTVLVAVGALMAFGSGMGTSSASAALFELTNTPCEGGTNRNLCWVNSEKEKLELKGSQTLNIALAAAGGGLRWIARFLPAPIAVLCLAAGVGVSSLAQVIQINPLGANGKTEFSLLLGGCSVSGEGKEFEEVAKRCKVPAEDESRELSGEFTSGTELLVKPKTGTVVIEFAFENNGKETCPATLKGKRAFTGEEVFDVVNPGTAEEAKEIQAVLSSKLKFNETAAELEGSLVLSFPKLLDNVYLSSVA